MFNLQTSWCARVVILHPSPSPLSGYWYIHIQNLSHPYLTQPTPNIQSCDSLLLVDAWNRQQYWALHILHFFLHINTYDKVYTFSGVLELPTSLLLSFRTIAKYNKNCLNVSKYCNTEAVDLITEKATKWLSGGKKSSLDTLDKEIFTI